MDYIEEITPGRNTVKVLTDKNQFLVFDSKGSSIYADSEGRSMVHPVPFIVFVGNHFKLPPEYEKPYIMLKVRDQSMIIPYRDTRDKRKKYIFIEIDKDLEMLPVRMLLYDNVVSMVRNLDVSHRPDYAIIDDHLSSNDIIIIKNRYKVEHIINADINNNMSLLGFQKKLEKERRINLNMMSENPVFLTLIHLKNRDYSLITQLMLDFDLTTLDTEYILTLLNHHLDKEKEDESSDKKYLPKISQLVESFQFYQDLLNLDGEKVRQTIDDQKDIKALAPMRTLIQKGKSIYPNREEQLFFNEIDEYLMAKRKKIKES